MRKAILMMLLAIMSNSALAEWREIGGNDKFTVYINPKILWKDGKVAKMWHLFDYKAMRSSNCHIDYISSVMQYEYDCKQRKFRSIYLSAHAEHMGQGEGSLVQSSPYPDQWEPVVSGSFGHKLFNMACGMEKSRPL
jgi:hypothetical protein